MAGTNLKQDLMKILLRSIPLLLFGIATASATAADAERGAHKYQLLCASCHGAQGKADGPATPRLRPQPRDFSAPEWQAAVTDEYLRLIITKGGAATGRSPMMAPWGHAFTPEQLNDLIAFIRTLGD